MSHWQTEKESWDDKVLRFTGMIGNGLHSYLEKFEPSKLETLHRRLAELEKLAAADEAKACAELDKLIEIWEADAKRMSCPATDKDIKSLHATKTQLGIGVQEYRDILAAVSGGKVSSKDLKHYEAMLAVRRMYDINKESNQLTNKA